jgi:hypothetical protein
MRTENKKMIKVNEPYYFIFIRKLNRVLLNFNRRYPRQHRFSR